MALAKCLNCGADIEVDENKDAGNCPMCGEAFITQKVINNYQIGVRKNININGDDEEKLLLDGITLIDLWEYWKAVKVFRKYTDKKPQDFRGWYYKAKALFECNDDFDGSLTEEIDASVENALSLAENERDRDFIKPFCREYFESKAAYYQRLIDGVDTKIFYQQKELDKINQYVGDNDNQIKALLIFVLFLSLGTLILGLAVSWVYFFVGAAVTFIPLCLISGADNKNKGVKDDILQYKKAIEKNRQMALNYQKQIDILTKKREELEKPLCA